MLEMIFYIILFSSALQTTFVDFTQVQQKSIKSSMNSQTRHKLQTKKHFSLGHLTLHNKLKTFHKKNKSTPLLLTSKNTQNSAFNPTETSIKGLQVQYSCYQDVRKSNFTYHKLIIMEKMIFFMSLTQLLLGFFQAEASQIALLRNTQSKMLLTMSIMTSCFIVMAVFRKLLILRLGINQHFIYSYSHKSIHILSPAFWALIKDKSNLIQLIIEVILVSLHPNLITQNYFIEFTDMEYNMLMRYNMNNMLSYCMILKFYIIFRSLVALFKVSTPRAARVCNMLSLKYDFMYRVKCIQREYPIKSIFFVELLVIIIFGFALRVSQGKFSLYNNVPKNGFEKIENCLWFIFITMHTVGYGDLVVDTSFGRVIASFAAISGIFFSTIMIVSLTNYMQEHLDESKARFMLHKMIKRQKMQSNAANALSQIAKLADYLKKEQGDKKIRLLDNCEQNLEKWVKSTKNHKNQLKECSPEQNTWYSMDQKFQKIHIQFKKFEQKQAIFKEMMKKKYLISTPKISEIYKKIVRNSLNCYKLPPK